MKRAFILAAGLPLLLVACDLVQMPSDSGGSPSKPVVTPPAVGTNPGKASQFASVGCSGYNKLSWLAQTANSLFGSKYQGDINIALDVLGSSGGFCDPNNATLTARGEAAAQRLVIDVYGVLTNPTPLPHANLYWRYERWGSPVIQS